jgi:hypothetical protein
MRRTQQWRVAAFLALVSMGVFAIATNSQAQTYSDEPPPPPTKSDSDNDVKPAPSESRSFKSETNGARLPLPRGIPQEHLHWLGVWLVPAHPVLRGQMNLGDAGLVVQDVFAGTPAHQAGFEPNDVLFEASGAGTTRTLRLRSDLGSVVMAAAKSDEPLQIRFLRNGEEQTREVVPALRPAPMFGFAPFPRGTEPFDGEWVFRDDVPTFVGPVAPSPPFLPTGSLPDNLTISITRTGNQPAQITVQRDNDRWEVTDRELDRLPADVRGHVARAVGAPALTTPPRLVGRPIFVPW